MHMYVYLYGKIGQEFNFGCLIIMSTFSRWPHPTVEMRSDGIFNSIENNQRLKSTEKYWVTQIPWNASS